MVLKCCDNALQARFDRHFVRDLVWSRHQLEELAERRWQASQEANKFVVAVEGSDPDMGPEITFSDLFKKVKNGTSSERTDVMKYH